MQSAHGGVRGWSAKLHERVDLPEYREALRPRASAVRRVPEQRAMLERRGLRRSQLRGPFGFDVYERQRLLASNGRLPRSGMRPGLSDSRFTDHLRARRNVRNLDGSLRLRRLDVHDGRELLAACDHLRSRSMRAGLHPDRRDHVHAGHDLRRERGSLHGTPARAMRPRRGLQSARTNMRGRPVRVRLRATGRRRLFRGHRLQRDDRPLRGADHSVHVRCKLQSARDHLSSRRRDVRRRVRHDGLSERSSVQHRDRPMCSAHDDGRRTERRVYDRPRLRVGRLLRFWEQSPKALHLVLR